jgi:catechol 2,3-dioxygenase-like lactoylglutathione lyase family enzyme
VGCFKIDRGGAVVIQRAFPARDAHAPFVARFESGKAEFRMRRDEIIAIEHGVIQELSCDFDAHRVLADIFRPCSTKSVAIKSGNRIATTTFQFCSQNIRRHKRRLHVSIAKILAREETMPIRAKYVHTNLIARDWKRLVRFYTDVFGCEPKGLERDMSGEWLDRVTGLCNAHLIGVHLRLPGYGNDGPTLEIFNYDQLIQCDLPAANRCGFGHIAFAVDDVEQALQAVIAAGGGAVGKVATTQVDRVGLLRVVYARDPEGNIVELQKWS